MIFNLRERKFRKAVGDAVFKVTCKSHTWSTRLHVDGSVSVYDGWGAYVGLFTPKQSRYVLKYVVGGGVPNDAAFEAVLTHVLRLRTLSGDDRFDRIVNELGLKWTDQLGARLDEMATKYD